MSRVFNFSPGPAALPEAVLQQAADEMLDWHRTGMSIMEMSHRGKHFMGVAEQAEADLRALMGISDDYHVLFMQGGAIAENALVPLNLLRGHDKIALLETGHWSARSLAEAQRYASVEVVASSREARVVNGKAQAGFSYVPDVSSWQPVKGAAYLHVCGNETLTGVEIHDLPDVTACVGADTPIVDDASSYILSRPVNVSRYGLIFAGAQKNIGPAGVTLVIVRKDLVGRAHPMTPSAFDYAKVAENHSLYNTPPTFGIYLAGLVFKWLLAQGGLTAMATINAKKAELLYGVIDRTGFYENRIDPACRSKMNVSFYLRNESLNEAFLAEAQAQQLVQLKGHKAVGGMRASLYNAVSLEAVTALVTFMQDFERRHG